MAKEWSGAPILINEAASTLLELWIPGPTRAYKRESGVGSTGSTSSPRATLALVDAIRYFDGARSKFEHHQAAVNHLTARAQLLSTQRGLASQRLSDINYRNTFTDAHLALELALLRSISDHGSGEGTSLIELTSRITRVLGSHRDAVASDLSESLSTNRGGTLADQRHDFVTYHAVRAIDFITPTKVGPQIVDAVQTSVLSQTAHHASGNEARFDLSALVFGISLLQRCGAYYEPLVSQGIKIVCERQSSDGSWPELRTISDSGRTLFVSSYEVGLTLINLFLQRADYGETSRQRELLKCVRRVLELATFERRPLADSFGWGNDRNPSRTSVESWTTAVVCSLAVRYEMARSTQHRRHCFAKYDPGATPRPRKQAVWPDLAVYSRIDDRRAQQPSDQGVLRISDPTPAGDLAAQVFDKFVMPLSRSWVELPANDGVSILLPGDPGTRKTTLVNQVAEAIDWPILTLTPPVFLREGLERFEKVAAEVFKDLQALERVVVFFDECEEFFRKRDGVGDTSASRTIGAFITAGMLPRLQALHDNGRVIFVVATNALMEELDPAATRRGRFDLRQEMRQPERAAQLRYLRARFVASGSMSSANCNRCVREVSSILDDLPVELHRSVPFANLDQIANTLIAGDPLTPEVAKELLTSS